MKIISNKYFMLSGCLLISLILGYVYLHSSEETGKSKSRTRRDKSAIQPPNIGATPPMIETPEALARRKSANAFFALLSLTDNKSIKSNRPAKDAEPIIVLTEYNVWMTFPGSDTPVLVIYSDGSVIFCSDPLFENPVYRICSVSHDELNLLLTQLEQLTASESIEPFYSHGEYTDSPTTLIYLKLGNRTISTLVYDVSQEVGIALPRPGAKISNPMANVLPKGLQTAYLQLVSMKLPHARLWKPDRIEIVLIGLNQHRPTDTTVLWPDEWPTSTTPFAWFHGDLCSIYLPGGELDKARIFSQRMRSSADLFMDGSYWQARMRHVFPGEAQWRKPDEQAKANTSVHH